MPEKTKKFDVFISYRRSGGYDSAKLIYDRLRLDGYSVSFDLDTLENGNFDNALEKRVNECKDFLLVLSPGVFDRFSDADYNPEDDWVRQEIICALKENKNIVPLVLDGFEYPKTLPDDIKEVSRKNSIDLNPKHFESAYEKLKKVFMLSKPSWAVEHKKKIISFIVAMLLLLSAGLYLSISSSIKKEQELREAKIAADSIMAAKEEEFARMSDSIKLYVDSLKEADAEADAEANSMQEMPSLTKAGKKLPARTLHWGGTDDNIGQAIFKKIAISGVKKTRCSGNGAIVKINNASCKMTNAAGQFSCSYSPKFTLANCSDKQLRVIETNMNFKTEPLRNEARAREDLANQIRKADFSKWAKALK